MYSVLLSHYTFPYCTQERKSCLCSFIIFFARQKLVPSWVTSLPYLGDAPSDSRLTYSVMTMQCVSFQRTQTNVPFPCLRSRMAPLSAITLLGGASFKVTTGGSFAGSSTLIILTLFPGICSCSTDPQNITGSGFDSWMGWGSGYSCPACGLCTASRYIIPLLSVSSHLAKPRRDGFLPVCGCRALPIYPCFFRKVGEAGPPSQWNAFPPKQYAVLPSQNTIFYLPCFTDSSLHNTVAGNAKIQRLSRQALDIYNIKAFPACKLKSGQ